MATAISRRVSRNRTIEVRIATVGIKGKRTKAAVAISWIRRWPAVRLAVSRTPRARGRIKRLIVSMIISTGISGTGVPSGKRWPRAAVGWFRIPIITVASHNGTARPILSESCVVGVNVYGSSPSMFRVIRNSIREVSRAAHLWPPRLSGKRSCWVNRLMNHPWRVIRRLFSHRAEGVGKRIHGRVNATAISGIPKYVGLINWSKKLSVMVSFRVQV